jgi:hypothetical protein
MEGFQMLLIRPAMRARNASVLYIHALITCLPILMPQPIVAAPTKQTARYPADPFQRLLFRLDHAPFDFTHLSISAEHGSRSQEAAAKYAAAIQPVMPMLSAASQSKTLTFISHVPYVGGAAASVQHSLAVTAAIGTGFVRLVDLDRQQLQPLRNAIRAGEKLRHSRQRRDLAETTTAFTAALRPLRAYETMTNLQNEKIKALLSTLDNYEARTRSPSETTEHSGSGRQGTLKEAIDRLRNVSHWLSQQARETRLLRTYTEDCVEDGLEAMKH